MNVIETEIRTNEQDFQFAFFCYKTLKTIKFLDQVLHEQAKKNNVKQFPVVHC